PVPLARLDQLAMRLPEQVLAEAERLIERTRIRIGTGVGGDPHQSAQRERRDTKPRVCVHDVIEPASADGMLRYFGTKCVDEDVDVRQDHLKCFMRSMYSRSSISCSAAESEMSMPGNGPPTAELVRGITRLFSGWRAASLTTSRSPSSISDVSVRPSAAALRLARASN